MLSVLALLLMRGSFFTLRMNTSTGSFPRPLKPEEEKQLLERSARGDLGARNQLIEHNLRLVAHIVKKYYTQTGDADDLISIGTIGLIKAVNTYQADKKIKLATYAARCIENAILSQMRFGVCKREPLAKNALAGVYSHNFRRTITSCVGLWSAHRNSRPARRSPESRRSRAQ